MAGYIVDSASMVSCFHQIQGVLPPVPRVTLSGSPVTTVPATDPRIHVAPGCPFTVGTKPQPCGFIVWGNVSARVRVLGLPLYLQASPGPGEGQCQSVDQAPQGVPPLLKKLQLRVIAT